MKKISIKASIAAVFLSLALTPLGFAQGPAVTQAATQATADTQPLPGAKVAGLLTDKGELTQNGIIVLGIIGAVAFAALYLVMLRTCTKALVWYVTSEIQTNSANSNLIEKYLPISVCSVADLQISAFSISNPPMPNHSSGCVSLTV